MKAYSSSGKEKVIFQSKKFEIILQPMKIGKKIVEFDIARRPPGVRLLIIKNRKILLTREFRSELNGYDYRLPGGKVFDTIEEYRAALRKNNNIMKYATSAAKKECIEETGLRPLKMKHIHTTPPGSTVIWDLFYFLISDFKVEKQNPEIGEVIRPEWHTFEDVKKMCLDGRIQEDRTVALLLRFLLKND
jgi:ADP-ribose pyrophosphatase